MGRTGKAAFVVEVSGRAEVCSEGGKVIMEDFAEEMIRIHPRRIASWGVDSDAFGPQSRSVG